MSSQVENNNSIIMDLENLQKQYSNLLISYKASVSEYINYLNNSASNPSFVTIQGYAYNGTGSAGQSNATGLQECIASCSTSNICTGATFVSNRCLIRTGDSPIVSSTNDSYAIVPKEKQLLLNMENINNQLLNINTQLLDKIETSKPIYYKTDEETSVKNQELIKSYENLLEERKTIEKMLDDYETLSSTQNENDIKLTQNYYGYILLVILSITAFILLYVIFGSKNNIQQNIQTGGDLNKNNYLVIFGLIILIVVINFFFRKQSL